MVALHRDPNGLYLPTTNPTANALFFVFADATVTDATIDVSTELLRQRGFFLFTDAVPAAATDRARLAADARAEMQRIPPAQVGWLERANNGSRILFALFVDRAGGVLRIAPEQTGLAYKQSFTFRLREALAVTWNEASTEIVIDNSMQRCSIVGTSGAVTSIATAIRIPAFGADAGRFLFDVTANDQALDVLDIGLRVFSRRSGPFPGVVATRFPVFDARTEPVALIAALDPLEVSATASPSGLRGTSLRFDGNTALTTHYRTDAGNPLVVTPAAGARLAFCDRTETLQAGARRYYLVPDGDFAIGDLRETTLDAAPQTNLLAGATGTEYVKLPPQHLLRFRPGQPALTTAAPGANGPFLEAGATTAWVEIASTDYVGEPEDAPLYGSRAARVDALTEDASTAPPLFGFEEHEKRTLGEQPLPLLPLGGLAAADVATALALESDAVSRQRRIETAKAPRPQSRVRDLAAAEVQPRRLMTPHGLIRDFDAAGAEHLLIARDPSQAQLEFRELQDKFRDAIGRNRLMLVMSRDGGAFGSFVSKTSIAGWQFDLKIDLGTQLGEQAIVILKFDDRPLLTLLEHPELWAEPDTFNADVPAVLAFLRNHFAPVVNSDKREHRRIKDALTRPSWNGFLAVNATIDLPPQARCLSSGLPAVLRAHHIALELSDVDASAGLELRDSSFFALLDYSAAFQQPGDEDVYSFQVTRLQVLFENSRITDFQCTAILFARALFDDRLAAPQKFTIKGHYENHDGKETYTFLNEDVHELDIDSPVIRTLVIQRIALITVDANPARIVSRFLLTGSLQFEDLSGLLGLDFFSFEALHFDRTGLEMIKAGGAQEIRFDAGEIGIDVRLNDLRGLLKKFPLKLKRFRRFAPGITLPDLGMIPIFERPVGPCGVPRYALFFDLDLGSFGGLTSAPDFTAELLLAWCGKSVWGGIRLPESKGGPKSLGLEGVIQILVDDFAFKHFQPEDVYCLVLRRCAIEILGVRFPSGDRPDIYIFVDPKRLANGQDAGIGWLLNAPSDSIGPFTVDRFVLGQRVGPPVADVRTVTEALDALTKLPPTDAGVDGKLFKDRLVNLFQPSRGWLIGTKMQIGELLTFGFVFNDPALYGALLKIEKPVDFQIEITYRKITEDIGVYHAEVTLPESMRQWEFGAVSVTIPVIGVSVFTNGDFLLDVGYPHNLDFSRSCTIQALPFLGSGGFYYGKLSPATSSALPVQGLDTVVEIGFGMRIGLGKEFSRGILKAGVSVAVYGLLEGALGYLEGADWTDPSEYLVRGRVGIIAQIFGVVDFGIVKAGVSVTLSVGVGIELGSRVDTVLWIEGRVSVQVEVVIGRIRIWRVTIEIKIRFSFSAEVRFSWVLERKNRQNALADAAFRDTAPPLDGARAFALPEAETPTEPLSWVLPAAPANRIPIGLVFAPEVTLVSKAPHIVGGLVITAPENGESAQTDFDRVVDELARWAVTLHAGAGDPDVTRKKLLEIDARLHAPKTLARTKEIDATKTPLDYATLCAFLRQTFALTVNGVAEGDRFTGTFFPMIPDATLTVSLDRQPLVQRDLWSFNLRTEAYQDDLTAYFRDLAVNLDEVEPVSGGTAKSLATIVFEDYFDFIVKAAIDRLWQRMVDNGIETEKLSRLLADTAFDDLAGMAARFFKQGLRIPSDTALTRTAALYDQLGLQVPLPRPATPQNEVKVALELRNVSHQCAQTGAIAPEVELDRDFFAELDRLNLDIEPSMAFAPTDPIRVDSRRFALQRWQPWNRAGADSLLWPLPPSLETELRKSATSALRMLLVIGSADHPFAGEDRQDVGLPYSWATRIDLTMRRVQGPGGALLEDVFEIGGTTERNRLYLDDLLAAIDPAQPPHIELLFAGAAGLVSPVIDAATVLLVRGNYSTETTPPPEVLPFAALADATPAFVDRAAMSESAAFLRLVQECSFVNTGGYFLRYDHTKLPQTFPQGTDPAVISLVITSGDDSGKPVRRYHNALAIANAGRVKEATDSARRLVFYGETTELREATTLLEPGCVAFEIERPNPELGDPDSWVRNFEVLYNLLEYKVPQQNGFGASKESLPLTPIKSGGLSETPDAKWRYQQVVPVHRHAIAKGLYASTGLDVSIDFDFRDCFGNKLHANGAAARRAFPIRYFDKLIAAGAWPGVASSYRVVKDGSSAKLVVTFDFDPRPFEQQTSQAREAVIARVARIAEQLTGPGVKLSVSSSLRADEHVLSTSQTQDLVKFVRAIEAFLAGGGSAPQPRQLSVPVAKVDTLPPFFELTVAFAIERNESKLLDANVVLRDPEVAKAVSVIAPQSDSGSLTSASLRHFAEELEKGLPGLRVAVGTAGTGSAGVWAVRLGTGGAIDIEAEARNVRFYAIPPITTDRIPGDVDYDVLGRRFLEAVDWFVGPELGPHVARLTPDAFDSVAARKRELADALASQLTPLLAKHDAGSDPLIGDAREILRQKLLIALTTAYKVDVVMAYPCRVSSPLGGGARAPKLYGGIEAKAPGGARLVPLGLTPAKLDVGTEGTGTRTLAFLLDVFQERDVASLPLELSYAITHLEYFPPAKERDPFSRWLKFVLPVAPESLGTPDVPVPLRQYPLAPRIDHRAVAGAAPAAALPIQRARQWTYEITLDADNAAQDTLTLEIALNVQQRLMFAADAEESLLDALLRFERSYASLQAELRNVAATGAGDAARIREFAELVSSVTSAWQRHAASAMPFALATAAAESVLRYEIREERPQQDRIVVKVTRLDASAPLPQTIRIDKWRLLPGTPVGNTATFIFAPVNAPADTRERTLVFAPFDVLREESAWSSVKLARNAVLGGEQTHEKFIYRTPVVKASEPIVVLRTEEAPIAIPPLGGGSAAPLATHLARLFGAIFAQVPQSSRRVKIETRYAFDLRRGTIGGADPVVARVPVQLTPPFDLTIPDTSAYVLALERAIREWRDARSPSAQGSLLFDVTVFAAAGAESLPVLRLTNLQLPMNAVTF